MEGVCVRALGATLISIVSYLLGVFDGMLMALFTFIGLDFVTGIIKSVVLKEMSSACMLKGGIKKIGILFIVAVGNIIDVNLELGGALRTVTISYFIANEGISILENWGKMGLPIPEKLKGVLMQLRNTGDKDCGNDDDDNREE